MIRIFCANPTLENWNKLSSDSQKYFRLYSLYCIKKNICNLNIAKKVIKLSSILDEERLSSEKEDENLNEEKKDENIRSDYNLSNIYLNTKQRQQFVELIKNELVDIQKIYGKNCVNGFNKNLLQKLDLKKLLGRGAWGNVFLAGCNTDLCQQNSFEFAVKLTRITNKTYKSGINNNNREWKELHYLRYITKLVEQKICPNLPLIIDEYVCSKCDFTFESKNKLKKVTDPCLILLTELATGGTLSDWLESNPTEEETYSALFQIMAGIHAIQYHLQLINNDIKAPNILVYNVNPGGYWHYIINKQDFYVPNFGKLFVINDFGVSYDCNPRIKLYNKSSEIYKKIGSRHIIINNKFSNIKTTKKLNKNKQIIIIDKKLEIPVKYIDFETQNSLKNFRKIIEISSPAIYTDLYINKNDKIVDLGIELSKEQQRYLRENNVTYDYLDLDFYDNVNIIPPVDFVIDTQNCIRVFHGNIKMVNQTTHHTNSTISYKIKKQLNKYLTHPAMFWTANRTKPQNEVAMYFIIDFFTKYTNYTDIPDESEEIEMFEIS